MATGGNAMARLAMVVAALALLSTTSEAQEQYPSKPVRIVVSFAAGGPTDIVARVMGAKMSDLLGQQFIVENKSGAGGNIGADMAARSAPDGYTLLMATVSTHAINPGLYKKMPYDAVRDFAPIGQVGVTPTLLGVHPSVPRADVKSPRQITAETNCACVGSALTIHALSGGMNSGMTKYQRNIWTSSGTLRKSSTHALPARASAGDCVVRIVPITAPTAIAMTHEAAETPSVHHSPEIRRSI